MRLSLLSALWQECSGGGSATRHVAGGARQPRQLRRQAARRCTGKIHQPIN
jgi:hypothetical protein